MKETNILPKLANRLEKPQHNKYALPGKLFKRNAKNRTLNIQVTIEWRISTTPVIQCDAVWTYLKFCYICSGSNLTFQCPFLLCYDLLHHLWQFIVLFLYCLVLLFPLHLQLFCSPHLLFTFFTAKLQGRISDGVLEDCWGVALKYSFKN